ncbi:MAG: hypothetical protein KDN19_17450 [Verrucomicrobiae bacterium]|nr:hypothetical protein [Verrucomicrobiae bacterium]
MVEFLSPLLRSFLALLIAAGFPDLLCSQESSPTTPDRLGVLLDVSPEMGFLIPQTRKELRKLNQSLQSRDRPSVPLREFAGAGLDREGSLSVPARKNALYQLRDFYQSESLDGVYWITALGGLQSGDGFFQLEEMLKAPGTGNSGKHQLILRHLWQAQVLAGESWATQPPGPDADPLDERNLPDDWFKLVKAGDGFLIRSWQLPPRDFRDWFGWPHQISHRTLLKKLGIEGRQAVLDTSWRNRLASRYQLEFSPLEESWPTTFLGRRWLDDSVLIPFIDDDSRKARNEAVFGAMAARDSIAEDLDRIPAKKLGVLFGFGFQARDLERFRSRGNRPIRDWRTQYLADLTRIVGETRSQIEADAERAERVYLSEFVELPGRSTRDAEPTRYAEAIARLVREQGVDAVYFFTNGYTGGGDYGSFEVDAPLIATAIREAGVNLYVRVPFEFGVAPIPLQQLALASGGTVFQGKAGDPDWRIQPPSPKWPSEPDDEKTAAAH